MEVHSDAKKLSHWPLVVKEMPR